MRAQAGHYPGGGQEEKAGSSMHLRHLAECSDDVLEVEIHTKVVHFLRHGQSVANRKPMRERQSDPALIDSPLTRAGMRQAQDAQRIVQGWNVQLVLTSPLTRAMQTACIAFENEIECPILAWPLVTELQPEYPESQGRLSEDLRKDECLTSLPRFSQVCLDNVVGRWWSIAGDTSRVHAFLAWLRWTPLTRLAVVSHSGWIRALLRAARYGGELSLHNCSYISTRWHPWATYDEHSLVPGSPPKSGMEYSVWLLPDSSARCELLSEMGRFVAAIREDRTLRKASFMSARSGEGADEGVNTFHVTLADFVPLSMEGLVELSQALRLGVDSLISNLPHGVSGWCVGAEPGGVQSVDVKVDQEKSLHARVLFQSQMLTRLNDALRELNCYAYDPLAVRSEFRATLVEDTVHVDTVEVSSVSHGSIEGFLSPSASRRESFDGDEDSEGPCLNRRFSLALEDFESILPTDKFPLLNSCLKAAKYERQRGKRKGMPAPLLTYSPSEDLEELLSSIPESDTAAESDESSLSEPDEDEILQHSEFLKQFSTLRWSVCVVCRSLEEAQQVVDQGAPPPALKREPGLTFPLWL